MRVTILAVGTRGDVQPYVALGLGLQSAGHIVRVAAASNYESFVRGFGLNYARLEGNFRALMEGDAMQRLLASRNPLRAFREATRMFRHILEVSPPMPGPPARAPMALSFRPLPSRDTASRRD